MGDNEIQVSEPDLLFEQIKSERAYREHLQLTARMMENAEAAQRRHIEGVYKQNELIIKLLEELVTLHAENRSSS